MALRNDKRTNRLITRISFLVVLLMAVVGWWYASTSWQFTLEDVQALMPAQDGDWVDFVAALGEDAIQIFIGLTSGGN